MSEAKAAELGLTPRARFHSFAVVGDDPLFMLTGPIPATRRILERSGLSLDDIDAYEVNEAFASVPLAWAKELDADPAKLNPWGGAIALGHAVGASGTRLLGTLARPPRGDRRSLRAADDVRGRRHGQRHDHRAALRAPLAVHGRAERRLLGVRNPADPDRLGRPCVGDERLSHDVSACSNP